MELERADIIDCQGRITHSLVLEVDGTVSITFRHGGAVARVDPHTRQVLTPGMTVPCRSALMTGLGALGVTSGGRRPRSA